MSDRPYEKECIFCQNKITMSKESGSWLPYNKNGSSHDCKTNGQNQNQKQYTLDEVRKKLESIGINLDLQKLMNQ